MSEMSKQNPDSADSSGRRPQSAGALIARPEALPSTLVLQDAGGGRFEDDDSINLREYWNIIVKRKWTVLTFFLITLAAVMTATFLMTKIYRASMTLQIDQQEAKVTQIQDVAPTETAASSREFYQTQYELLKSRTLAQRVIEQLNLSEHPLFKKKEDDSILGALFGKGEEQTRSEGNSPEVDAEAALVGGFLSSLTIEPLRNSRLVKVHFDSPSPQLAAQVTNTIATAYINLNLERRMDASSYAKTFLQERLQQVRAKLEDSERALNEFTRMAGIVKPEEKQPRPDSQALQEFTTALAKVQTERVRAETMYNQVKSGESMAVAAVIDNKVIQEYKARKAKLETDYQEGLKTFKPAYPKMVQLESQIAEMQAKIEEEVAAVRGALKANYAAAVEQEAMIAAMMQKSKGTVLDVQDRSFQFNLLQREVDTNRQLYEGLLQRYKEVGVAGGIGVNNITVVDKAEAPFLPYKPKVLLNALIAVFLGLFGGVALAFLFEHLDDTIKHPDELEKLLGLPVLGVVPMVRNAGGDDQDITLSENADPRSAFAEAYRSVRTALQFSTPEGLPKVLMLTSAMMGEGKSTSALSLAMHFTQAGKNVLLIDADLRKASLHKKLGVASDVGLTNYLTGDAQAAEVTRPCSIPKLYLIASGPLPPNPAELLGSPRMVALLSLAVERFDQVIIDGPPVLGLADAPLLGSLAEATILVVQAGSTGREFARNAVKRLRGTRTRLIGGLITMMGAKGSGYGYGYYHSYYYYQYGDKSAPEQERQAA